MTTWNNSPYPPPDPNQGYYGGQQQGGGYPPPTAPYGGPPPGAYPPPNMGPAAGYGFQGGMPPPNMGGYPGAAGPMPGAGFHMPPPTTGYVQQPDMYGTSFGNEEAGDVKGFEFNDQSIRRGFIRKVYSILMVQLSITMGFIALFLYHKPTQLFVHRHPELLIVSFVLVIVLMITLACCGEVRRKAPMNMILLFLFTCAESFMLATTASRYNSDEVLMAVGITAAVCLGLTLFAFQTKWDFTMMGGILFVAVIILLVFGIVAIFVKSKILSLVYASLGALIFSIYLIYDTQMMMGGKHKYSISPEEYVFAALNLYVDIINIFIYILTIIGASRD